MAADNITAQVNFKTPRGTLINVYAESNEALEAQVLALPLSVIVETEAALFAAATAAPLTAPQVHTDLPLQIVPLPVQQPAAQAGVKTCPHGAMTYRTGTNARGEWTGYFCPAPKGDPAQCKPQFNR